MENKLSACQVQFEILRQMTVTVLPVAGISVVVVVAAAVIVVVVSVVVEVLVVVACVEWRAVV